MLSGTIAAAYVGGVQSEGVGCTIKHFVCNDQENERQGSDSVVSQRALREIYLVPFMVRVAYPSLALWLTLARSRNATRSRGPL